MRWTLWLVAIFVFLHVADAGAQLTGAPSGDPRQLNFQLFEAAKKGRTRDVTLYLKRGASLTARDRFALTTRVVDLWQTPTPRATTK